MSRDIDMEEKTPLDLESYSSNYRGQMKVLRLQQIARTSSSHTLKSDALRMAYTEVKNNTQNVDLFLKICQMAKEATVQGCEEDHPWCNNKEVAKFNASDGDGLLQAVSESDVLKKRLEADLNAAKANNIRESIRQSSMDLGMYYFDRSDYVSASKMFMRTRDHCSNNVQMLDFCIAVIKTYVLTQNWPMVSTYVGKAEGILVDPKTDRQKQVQAQMHAVAGLADLSLSRYRQAAMSFSKVGSELGNSFDDVVASIDVARYGVLTALATHDRIAIRSQFLNSPTFSTHLECILEARELLEAICTSRFAEAFRILDDMKPALQMDPFLSNHLTRLTHHIRCRVLQQYTKPFHSLRLSDMAQALGCNLDDLEVELARLIVDDTINARIDSHNKVLYRKMTDERNCTIETVVRAVDDYIANAHSLLLRAELAKCNLKPVGGMEATGSVDIDYDGAHEGISAEIGGFPSSMIVDGFPAAPSGMGR